MANSNKPKKAKVAANQIRQNSEEGPAEDLEPKMDAVQIKQLETLSGLGLTIAETAAGMGMKTRTLERRLADTPEASEARARGKAIANSNVARVAYEMAKSGKNHHMTKFWLTTQAGWAETKRIEHTGPDRGPIETKDVSTLTDKELTSQLEQRRQLNRILDEE